ncbi:MAG: hypothetical protein EOO90_22460 [Pedobacter sp.]|nr:MAG: hypothetical protein EOO90_22460 [Pedobacter sp.]
MNDEILIKFLLNESSAEEQVEVHNWLNQNDENRSYFSGLQKIWVESKALGTVANRDVDLAWDKFKASTSASEVKTLKLKPRNVWMRVAAALVFALGSWLLYTMFDGGGYTDLNADNQVFSQLLPDGSELTLNKRSHLKFANNFKDNRSVQLDSGDVFFSVKSDKEKPFRVQIDQMMVEVVGTSFNIKHLKQETEVVVESGIVKVSLGSDEVLLHKGEKLVIGESNLKLKVEKGLRDECESRRSS